MRHCIRPSYSKLYLKIKNKKINPKPEDVAVSGCGMRKEVGQVGIGSLARALNLIPVCQQTPQALLQHSSNNEAVIGSRSARAAAAQGMNQAASLGFSQPQ